MHIFLVWYYSSIGIFYKYICSIYRWQVKIVDAGAGKCVAEMEVAEEHTNKGGTLHGGLTATLVDTISTVALMTTGPGNPGVSVDINVT